MSEKRQTILQLCELLKITNEMIFICEIYLINEIVLFKTPEIE